MSETGRRRSEPPARPVAKSGANPIDTTLSTSIVENVERMGTLSLWPHGNGPICAGRQRQHMSKPRDTSVPGSDLGFQTEDGRALLHSAFRPRLRCETGETAHGTERLSRLARRR